MEHLPASRAGGKMAGSSVASFAHSVRLFKKIIFQMRGENRSGMDGIRGEIERFSSSKFINV